MILTLHGQLGFVKNLDTKYATENAFKRVNNWAKCPHILIQLCHLL